MCVFIIYRIDFSFVTFFGFLLWRWCPDCAYCEETILVRRVAPEQIKAGSHYQTCCAVERRRLVLKGVQDILRQQGRRKGYKDDDQQQQEVEHHQGVV